MKKNQQYIKIIDIKNFLLSVNPKYNKLTDEINLLTDENKQYHNTPKINNNLHPLFCYLNYFFNIFYTN